MSLLDKDFPSLAAMPPSVAAAKLRSVGENDTADTLEKAAAAVQPGTAQDFGVGDFFGLARSSNKPWLQSGTTIGYLSPGLASDDSIPIISARRKEADATLKKTRVRITLDRFYVAKYPGDGEHQIVLHFATQYQESGNRQPEPIHFSTTCKALDGQIASVLDYPIFVGLPVGSEDLTIEYTTINVKNDDDEKILKMLNSDAFEGVFKAGILLVSTFQPMLAPFSALALGLAKYFFGREKNVNIGPFKIGFDFSTIPLHNHLAEGSYVVTQLPEDLQRTWNWNDWAYRIDSGLIIKKADPLQRIPYNYLIFSITRSQD
jgi:hypothetical protein